MPNTARVVRLLDREEVETLPIVKGIPIPPVPVKRGKSPVRATMRKLQVGDSFLGRQWQRNKAYQLAQQFGYEITVRNMGDGKYRIWRTK